MPVNQSNIITLTQSALAIIVTVGGGAFLFFKADAASPTVIAVVGIIGTVLGWYFRGAAESQFNTAQDARRGQ